MATVKQEPKEEHIEQLISFESDGLRQSPRISEKKAMKTVGSDRSRAGRAEVKDDQLEERPERVLKMEAGHCDQKNHIATEPAVNLAKKSKKEEKEAFKLYLASLARERWQEAGIDPSGLDLDNSLRGVWDAESGHVARTWLATTYGGSFVESIPMIGMDKYHQHGFWGKYMYLGLDLQPLGPQTPGSPGIWFSVGSGTQARFWNHGIMRVFTRIKVKPKCLWQYQGQYEVRPARSIGVDEWRSQSVLVRKMWVSLLRVKSWGARMRARIYARKYLSLEAPTEKKLEDIEKAGWDKKITEEEIHYSLNRGDERLILYTMKCIGYDYDFQRHLLANSSAVLEQDDEDEKKVKVEPDPEEPKLKREADSVHPVQRLKRLRAKEEA